VQPKPSDSSFTVFANVEPTSTRFSPVGLCVGKIVCELLCCVVLCACSCGTRFIKGAFTSVSKNQALGQYVGLDSEGGSTGKSGIRVGDGYHNYLNVAIVSCSCRGLLFTGQTILGATLRLRSSQIYGKFNPFNSVRGAPPPATMKADMVWAFKCACVGVGREGKWQEPALAGHLCAHAIAARLVLFFGAAHGASVNRNPP
jgi:hypothetical protein